MSTPIAVKWYAVQVRTQYENLARDLMEARGYETFLPKYKTVRHWSDRRKQLEQPLFPGYVFCQFPPFERNRIVTLRPVTRIVGAGGVPQAVDEEEFAALESVVREDLPREPSDQFCIGQRVLVIDGPLAGRHGRLDSSRGRHRFLVSISLIESAVAVEIPSSSLLPLEPKSGSQRRTAA